MADEQNSEMDSELAFLNAMQAFRSARDSGDSEAAAAAEEAWRQLVRNELRSGPKKDS